MLMLPVPRQFGKPDGSGFECRPLIVVLLVACCLTAIPASSRASSQCRIVQAKGFTFRVTTSDEQKLSARTSFLRKEGNGTVYWHYRHKRRDVCWNVTTDRMARPLLVSYSEGRSSVHFDFRNPGEIVMHGVWNGAAVERKESIPGNLTAEICMPARMVVRENKRIHTVKLLRAEKIPELKTCEMRLEITGKETVNVPAGTFACAKVRLTPVSPLLQPFYQGYIFISRDSPHYLVRTDNVPKGFDYVLESIQDLPVKGSTTVCVPEPSAGLAKPADCE